MRSRTGVDGLVTAIRMRTSIRHYAFRVLDAMGHAPLASETGQRQVTRAAVIGPAPLRVLVFGAGLAVGYGVTTRESAFDGPLTNLLSARLGRGVVLDNRARQHLRLSSTVDSLGAVGTHTYDVAVWCPSFADGLERLRLTSWRNQLHAMIRELREEERVPLLLTHIPVPAGWHPAAAAARPWVQRVNRVIDQVAAEHDRVVSVATEPFVPREIGQPITDAAYFEAVARRLDLGIGALLRPGVSRPVVPTHPIAANRRGG